jgi:integrase/recombinase XerD
MNIDISNFLASHAYSDATKATYAYILEELIEQPFKEWGAGDLLIFIKHETWGDSMQYVALNACKSFIKWSLGATHPALSARVKRGKPKPQRALNENQLIKLLALFDTYTAQGARDQCIMAIATDTGLRVSELASILLANVDLDHNTILAKIKGGQWKYGIYSPETAAILDRWLSYRKPADGVNSLFISLKENKCYGKPFTKSGIQSLFKRCSKKLGFRISPHDCRRGFATMATRNGAPSRVVQEAGRWSDIAMVERYTRTIEAEAIQPYLPMHNTIKYGS